MRPLGSKSVVSGRTASAIAAAAVVVALALASTALAAPTSIPKTFIGIKVIAAPHTQNNITIVYGVSEQLDAGFQRDAQFITDTAGLVVTPAEGQLCSQPVANATECADTGTGAGVPDGSTGTGEYPTISLGDLADTLVSDNVGDLTVSGGPGNDKMMGGSRPIIVGAFMDEPGSTITSDEEFSGDGGNDVLKGFGQPDGLDGGPGNDKIDGGTGRDALIGGAGNDVINAKDGQKDRRIDCGPGKDKARVDKVDPKPISC